MANVSAASRIFDILCEHQIGYVFTLNSLMQLVNTRTEGFSEGTFSGFIFRAKSLGNIEAIDRVRGLRKHTRYRLLDKTPWAFKHSSAGSQKGRTYHKDIKQEVLPLAEPEEKNVIVDTDNEKVQFSVDEGSLAEQLVAIAVQVAALEARQEKTIQDFTMNELIDEIKRRVDNGETK